MTVSSFFEPRPWLGLLQTDFSHLRHIRSEQLQIDDQSDAELDDDQTDSQHPLEPPLQILNLPSEVLFSVCSRLEPEQLSTFAQVCSKFLFHAYDPAHWRRIAYSTWPHESPKQLERQLYKYKSWRKLCTLRPRLRTNVIYMVRHQFAKSTTREAASEPLAPVFLVTYHRFLRFYSDGTVVSLTTPEPPESSFRRVTRHWMPTPADRDKAHPSVGCYELNEHTQEVNLNLPMRQPKFPNMRSGKMYMTFQLSHTKPGACDRLFLTDHYAIMENDGGELISYSSESFDGKPFRLVPIWGFRTKVQMEFPRDDHHDLVQWYEMKKQAREADTRGESLLA